MAIKLLPIFPFIFLQVICSVTSSTVDSSVCPEFSVDPFFSHYSVPVCSDEHNHGQGCGVSNDITCEEACRQWGEMLKEGEWVCDKYSLSQMTKSSDCCFKGQSGNEIFEWVDNGTISDPSLPQLCFREDVKSDDEGRKIFSSYLNLSPTLASCDTVVSLREQDGVVDCPCRVKTNPDVCPEITLVDYPDVAVLCSDDYSTTVCTGGNQKTCEEACVEMGGAESRELACDEEMLFLLTSTSDCCLRYNMEVSKWIHGGLESEEWSDVGTQSSSSLPPLCYNKQMDVINGLKIYHSYLNTYSAPSCQAMISLEKEDGAVFCPCRAVTKTSTEFVSTTVKAPSCYKSAYGVANCNDPRICALLPGISELECDYTQLGPVFGWDLLYTWDSSEDDCRQEMFKRGQCWKW